MTLSSLATNCEGTSLLPKCPHTLEVTFRLVAHQPRKFNARIDTFTIYVGWKMRIILKAITGSSGYASWGKRKCGTVRAREKSAAKIIELVAALGSSLCYVTYDSLAYHSKYGTDTFQGYQTSPK